MTEFQELRTFTIECPNPDCPDPTDVRRNGFEGEEQVTGATLATSRSLLTGKRLYKQFTAKQMATVIDAYFSEMSYKQTAEHLSKTQDIPQPSKRTVHDWTKAKSDIAYRISQRGNRRKRKGGHGNRPASQGKSRNALGCGRDLRFC